MSFLSYSAGEIDTAALDYDIYVARRTAEETVTDISSDHERAHSPLGGDFADETEYLAVQVLRNYCRHSISSKVGTELSGTNSEPSRP